MSASNRPRLLFISPRFLFPLDEGGKIRTAGILRAMHGGAFDITLASPVPPDFETHRAALNTAADRFVHWPRPKLSALGRIIAVAGSQPVSTRERPKCRRQRRHPAGTRIRLQRHRRRFSAQRGIAAAGPANRKRHVHP